jgi:hypothetical protein
MEGGRWKGAAVLKVEGGKELWYGRWMVERSCGMEGGWWKGAVVWKVDGGKELWYGKWMVERSCGMKGGRWKVFDDMDKAD